MWETLGREATRIFFTAHPGQIDGLCCGRSALSIYNVAFALHCPDLATPQGELISAAPLPPLYLLLLFSPLSFFFLFFPSPSAVSSLHTCIPHTTVFMILLCLHLSLSFISLALLHPLLPLALLSCLLVLLPYTVSQSPSFTFHPPLTSASRSPASSFIFRHCLSLLIFIFLLFSSSPLSCVYTLHLSNHSIVSFQSSLAVCLPLASSHFLFPTPPLCLRLRH